jgi:hypothetical protein
MAFDQSAVLSLVDKVTSHAMTLGLFTAVNGHEPKSAPGNGLLAAVWADRITPLPAASGLAAASGMCVLNVRIYGNMLAKPEDDVDPRLMTAATTLIGAYCGDFDFGATVRNVDVFGAYGTALAGQAGYLSIDGHMYRIITITVPVVINDMWNLVG